MTIDNFCFYLQNRLIQTSRTGGHDTSPFSIPWLLPCPKYMTGVGAKQISLLCVQNEGPKTFYNIDHRRLTSSKNNRGRLEWGGRGAENMGWEDGGTTFLQFFLPPLQF